MSHHLVLVDAPEDMLVVVKLRYKINCGGTYVGCRLIIKLGLCNTNSCGVFPLFSHINKLRAT